MRHIGINSVAALAVLACLTAPAAVDAKRKARPAPYKVRIESVMAHEKFLAGPELRGRGSATGDEAIAAAYVAAQFAQYGLKPAPGMTGYLQPAKVIRLKLKGDPVLAAAGAPVPGLSLIVGSGESISGKIAVFTGDKPADMPSADVVLVPIFKGPPFALFGAARAKKVKLLILAESAMTKGQLASQGNAPRLPVFLEGAAPSGGVSIATLPAETLAALAAKPGTDVTLTLPDVVREESITTNAIGYIPGTDPKAGTLLFSAHLDHLGVLPNGTVMHGANDDASGTVAVLEIAKAMAAGKRPRRSLLFVAYGSEEIGLFGSTYFGEHPPVPLKDIVANLEFEMIGAQDPKLPKGVMMMTGYERSDFGKAMKAHGALVTADPYPEQNFFQRSDNYALARQGIVAHTVSGWALVPTYHKPADTIENIDFAFMTNAIQSLIAPVKWLAYGKFTPQWTKDGKPKP
ncbi:MAG: peptidase M28 [Sphingobium sp.]|nr:peptidase M28 [Sphingobium sp.]